MIDLKQKEHRNTLFLYLVVFIGFLMFGFSENIKGPALPRMQSDFMIGEMEVGILLALNSAGYLLACSFTGFLSRKLGLKRTSLLAFGSMTLAGFLILFSVSFTQFTASYFLMYIGNGMLEIGLGILSARIFTKNTGRMMNMAHFFYGLSSTAGPVLATFLMGRKLFGSPIGWRGMYCAVLVLCVIPMLPAFFSRFPDSNDQSENSQTGKDYLRDPVAWLTILILSFGVVSELSIGGWLANFLEKVYRWTPDASAGLLSAFFLFFTLGRLILGSLTDKIGFVKSLILFSSFSGVMSIAGVIAGEKGAFLFALAGLGIAPIYPTVMAFLAKRYQKGTDMAVSITVTLMGIGSVLGNFMVGAVIDLFKSIFSASGKALVPGLQAGYLFIGLCALICAFISLILYNHLVKAKEII